MATFLTTTTRSRQPGTAAATARTVLLALATAACVLAAQPGASLAASPAGGTAAPEPAISLDAVSPRMPKVRVVKSVDEAVSDHLLDPGVVAALDRDGRATALVVLDGSSVRRGAAIAAGAGTTRASRLLAGLKAGHSAQAKAAFAGIAGLRVVSDGGATSVATIAVTSRAALLRVLRDQDVLGIVAPRSYQRELAESLPLINQPKALARGYSGAGTTIAILDTGVDYASGYFGTCPTPGAAGCKVIEARDFAPDDGWLDDDGHGTNVAGIASGVATGARLLAYDVFNGDRASDTDIVAAISRVVAMAGTYKVKAVNLSIGTEGTRYTSACATTPDGYANPYIQAFADLRAVGVIPVVAAGNDAHVDATGAFGAGVSYPGCTAGAVSVGAVYDSALGFFNWTDCPDTSLAADQVTCFSQSGPNLSLLAPGSEITAAGITESGTSQASPHVAGAVAVLAAARPSASVGDIVAALTTTGPVIADSRPGAGQKHRLDLDAALTKLLSTVDTTKPAFTTATPVQAIAGGYTLSTAGLTPVSFSWHATDASGIARYNVSLRVGTGSWIDYTASLGSPTAESLTFNLTPGTAYAFAVIAQDGAGNWGDWMYSAPVTVGITAENGTGVTYAGTGWTRSAWTSAVGGYLTVGGKTGAYARYTFTGKNVAWVATTATNRGQAKVYLDGKLVKTIDLYGATTMARKVQYSAAVDPSRSHTLDVQIVGTSGRPSVDVDAFVALR